MATVDFETTKINQLPLCDEIISVKRSQTIAEALNVLQSKNIHSLGVIDDEGDCFIGLITVFDIMTFICFRSYRIDQIPEELDAIQSLDVPIGDVVSVFHDETNRIWHFSETDLLSKTFDAFTLGVHQAVITTAENKFKFLSQHDLVKFFCSNETHADTSKSLKDCGFGPSKKLTCTPIESYHSALFAFRRMEIAQYSALPVLDSQGKVIATISASDVRSISPKNIGCVLKDVPKFLEDVHGTIEPPLTALPSESLASVMKKLVDSHHRHMWVVDEDGKIVNVITLSDIIDYCTQEKKSE